LAQGDRPGRRPRGRRRLRQPAGGLVEGAGPRLQRHRPGGAGPQGRGPAGRPRLRDRRDRQRPALRHPAGRGSRRGAVRAGRRPRGGAGAPAGARRDPLQGRQAGPDRRPGAGRPVPPPVHAGRAGPRPAGPARVGGGARRGAGRDTGRVGEEGGRRVHIDQDRRPVPVPELLTAVDFRPSRDGFRFGNAWPRGAPVRLAGVGFGRVYGGLCGGMAYEARRAWLAREPLPPDTVAPADGVLADRLFKAQLSSLRLPAGPVRYLWFQLPPNDRARRELTLRYGLDERPDGSAEAAVYDPNHPGDDTVRLRVTADGTVAYSHGWVAAFS